jgi:hypothetical protein
MNYVLLMKLWIILGRPRLLSLGTSRNWKAGILHMIHGNNRLLYSITDKAIINRILLEYQETFTDRVIDNYAEMIEKL